MAWTDDRVETLKQLWSEGLSASQIATKMGGVTRNAVIGKVHRLGLSGRATPSKPKTGMVTSTITTAAPMVDLAKVARTESATAANETAAKTKRNKKTIAETATKIKAKKRPVKTSIDDLDYASPLMLDSGELTTIPTLQRGMCKWPVGDPSSEEFHFCGQPSSTGKPYCAYHARLAFQPSSTKREVATAKRQLLARAEAKKAS